MIVRTGGITGAVLSIPIMCVLKIVLLNMPNPTATFIASVMEGQFEASRARWVAMSKQSQPEYRTSPPPNGAPASLGICVGIKVVVSLLTLCLGGVHRGKGAPSARRRGERGAGASGRSAWAPRRPWLRL